MFDFRHSVTIRRAAEDVFRLLTSFEDIPKYVREVSWAEQVTPGEVAVGTTFVQRGHFLGMMLELPTVVTIFDPPVRYGYRTNEGPMPYEAVYFLNSYDGTTRLDADVTVHPRGLLRLLQPLIALKARTAYGRNLGQMRNLLETDA